MKSLLSVLLLVFCLSSCNRCSTEKPRVDLVESPADVQVHVEEQIANQLQVKNGQPPSSLHISTTDILATSHVLAVYEKEKNSVQWSARGQLNANADTLLKILHQARDYGLIAKDYHVLVIDSLLRTALDAKTKKTNAVNLAQADILLTDAFFVFATHLNKGRLRADTILPAFKITEVKKNLDSLYTLARQKRNFRACFDSLEPHNEQYHLLKAQLQKFRMQWEQHPWETLLPIEKDTVAFYRSLKHLLIQTRDYDSTVKGNDSVKISKALKVFQKRYDLDTDGKLGKNTMRILHMTTEQRIRQIEVNMERLRMEPDHYPKRYLWVNIPQFEMKVMNDDTLFMNSRVVVGLPEKQTPLLESKIQYIMLYPYWNVPNSIATKEILPVLKRDTSYLRKKNFDVLDWHGNVVDPATINWKNYTEKHLPYRFRQREGEDNSLGIMKFNFTNKFGVYLHDTNSKKYFKRDVRALSHGCMRLENYMDLAKYLIRDDSVKYPVDSLLTDILKQQQKQVNLKKPLPIFTKYFSAVVDEEGTLKLFMDVYRRDELTERVLYRD
jgi:murein L,D-transpeptidase YcbB/YkuD